MNAPHIAFRPRGLFIGGRWVPPVEGKSFASINPATMEKLADVPFASPADVDAAVQAAKAAARQSMHAAVLAVLRAGARLWRRAPIRWGRAYETGWRRRTAMEDP
jgi:acyl-CoA reductase-like NAD-dependent aldehyde dehydrogenase